MDTIPERDEKGWIYVEGQKEYQGIDLKMLQHNTIPGFLELRVRYVDQQCRYYYDASGLCSFAEYLKGKQIDYKTIKDFYGDIVRIYRNCQEYFLREDNCILQPDYLFLNKRKGEWKVCYFPGFERSPEKQLEELNQYLLKKINHGDKQGVRFLYGIYELIQQEGYRIEEMEEYIRRFLEEEKEIKEEKKVERIRKKKKEKNAAFFLKRISFCYSAPDRIELFSGTFWIGRTGDNDLMIPATQISRRHAKITIEDDKVYLNDCQSTNGTYLNGIKIAGNQEVSCQEKDVISFGNISYELEKAECLL